ncbi:hypothetical protein B5P41_35020, partial [Bacillus sp. SRB_28]
NIEDVEVLTKLAGEVELSKDDFRDALVSRKYREIHQEELKHAYEEAQIMAVPTFIIGDEVIQGLATKEKLAQVIDKELEKNKANDLDGMQCDRNGYC